MNTKPSHDKLIGSSIIHQDLFQDDRKGKRLYQSEVEIWNAFKDGDEGALIYIYQEYANKMYNYGCQFTRQHEWVSDCIQELFTEMISKRHTLGDAPSIKFYLFKALRRKIVRRLKQEEKYIRDEQYLSSENFNILKDTSVKFIDQEFSDQQKEIISKECNKLPPRQKEALLLYFYEGMSYQEIAQIIGMTRTKSARALIYRAMDSLSKHLLPYKSVLYPFWPFLLATPFL